MQTNSFPWCWIITWGIRYVFSWASIPHMYVRVWEASSHHEIYLYIYISCCRDMNKWVCVIVSEWGGARSDEGTLNWTWTWDCFKCPFDYLCSLLLFNTLLTAYWALYQLMLLLCCSGSCCCCYCDCCCCFYCLKCACCCCFCYCGCCCCCNCCRQRNSFDHTLLVPFGSVYTMISKMSSLSHRWNHYLYICLTDCGYWF